MPGRVGNSTSKATAASVFGRDVAGPGSGSYTLYYGYDILLRYSFLNGFAASSVLVSVILDRLDSDLIQR